MYPFSLGIYLNATPLLDQTIFANTQIFIHQSDETGTVGFIINKRFNRSLNELTEFAQSKPVPLYNGGPADQEHLFFLHRKPELINGGRHIIDDVYFGGDFNKAVALLNNGQLSEQDIRIFIGYCGWDKEQLQDEIDEGSWEIVKEESGKIFRFI